ncbi:MAG: FumA C-terminus/TtdB family hydratase beta subunit [Candidatus Omnitrophica bacterium]|nr:FumA C-terminus/TtdB family hydratase beta subunit [Candidatus Omnitrophota bacterium]
MKKISTPLTDQMINSLKSGDEILLTGTIYTARDQAHKRLSDTIKKVKKMPVVLGGQIIYYCGPTAAPRGKAIGSCGPTTSSRMDEFTPLLLSKGLRGMIGKGRRSEEVIKAIKKHKAVYFLAYAGCGALISKFIQRVRLIAYKDLGPEAIYRLEVKGLPLIVAIDTRGRSIYN